MDEMLHTQHKQQLADISGIYQNILSVCLFDDRIDTETKKNMVQNPVPKETGLFKAYCPI
ncbi:hypothetical protein Hamer_G026043 [Homarus americanus]|uniref:Uncharacterized protein n=1 Tax=Homarus americanus TaxID=6706 RepID=A0A8J5NED1_HOMAM|nr:hypothetical protein Hamer_G026043 [Homarus americanus]